MLRTLVGLAILIAGSFSFIAAANSRGNLTHGCLQQFDPGVDYFPDKVTVQDAIGFKVEYHPSYKLVTIPAAWSDGPADRYVLLQCGAPPPRLEGPLAGAQVVPVPITSMFSSSTTHTSLLVDLGRLDVLTGVSRLQDLVGGDEIQQRAASGTIREFGAGGVTNAELVVASKPSILMAAGSFSASLATIRAAGVPVVANTEWLEPTALARAEWIKYLALFLNEERAAQTSYAAMKGRYRALSAKATAAPRDSWPRVMTGRGKRGSFVIAGGRSYVAALIKDAGGRYVWEDNTSTGAPAIDLEAQIARAGTADIWINGGGWPNRPAMLADEPRYAEFHAFQTGQVWVYERRQLPNGSNDYWTRSVSHPDLVLADLVKIFHPALMSDHTFEWYMPVPAH